MRTVRDYVLGPELVPYAATQLAATMRPEDEEEARLLHPGADLNQIVRAACTRTWEAGGRVYGIATCRKETIAVLGIRPCGMSPVPHARPWLLCTTQAKWYAPALTSLIRERTDAWAFMYKRLANACLATNTSTQQWLSSIGFVLDYENPIEQAGAQWIRFTKE
jgi:hypothetical protein